MGQRSTPPNEATTDTLRLSVFVTSLGYWAMIGRDDVLFGLTLGHSTPQAAQESLVNSFADYQIDKKPSDWFPQLRQRLERYSSGDRVTFDDIKLHLPPQTSFQKQIIAATRKLPYGAKVTYGELAARARHPRAARAVGTVMSTNRIPIIIPCHRVVASGGLGGYSAPQGLSLKERLLQIESDVNPQM